SSINTIPCNFYATTIENYRPSANLTDCVIIDPPRQGISRKGRKTIIAMDPANIVYISCNPVTFARDIRSFIDSNYRLQKLFMIDMFPCTHHTEVIGLMKKS
ncbi:MAG TPA: 23S rRNA (uracil-5-)-methyltransferase RumA, partial [Spirochaetota bacterium]|nr:23S rRNA (uracil-5-)-methyltransferase RumA [Spirochaetota bacterium]